MAGGLNNRVSEIERTVSGGGISVREVQVRRVRTDEVERWNALAREHHDLVFKEFCGN